MPIQQLINQHYHALAKLYLESRGRSIDDNGGADWIEAAKGLRQCHRILCGLGPGGPVSPNVEDYSLFLKEIFGDAHLITVPDGERNYPALKIVEGKPELPVLDELSTDSIGASLGAIEALEFALERIGQGAPEILTISGAEHLLQARYTTLQYLLAHKDE